LGFVVLYIGVYCIVYVLKGKD